MDVEAEELGVFSSWDSGGGGLGGLTTASCHACDDLNWSRSALTPAGSYKSGQ